MAVYLDFEEPLKDLYEEIEKVQSVAEKTGVNADATIKELKEKVKNQTKEIFSLNPNRCR